MKAMLILMTLVTFTRSAYSQSENEQFRVDCDIVAILPGLDSDWSEWFDANNTFIINANENKDIIHHRGDGETVVYQNLSSVETLYTDSGERYQIIKVIDEYGKLMDFQLFDNPSIGVKLIKEGMAFQFFTNQ